MGTNSGYVSFDLYNYKLSNNNFSIDKIEVSSIDSDPELVDIKSDFVLDYENNNISFEYSVTNYQVFEKNEFQYRLGGYNDNWSAWSEESANSYNNLMSGSYIFELKTKNGDLINPDIKTISFRIANPWYLSNFMLVNYVLLSGLMLFITNTVSYTHLTLPTKA